MILTGPEIEHRVRVGDIEIEPPSAFVGPNSADLRLGDEVLEYAMRAGEPLDVRNLTTTARMRWEADGSMVLHPGRLYLARTVESITAHGLVPQFHGRSTWGRVGLSVHVTAGLGDDGWSGPITLELTAVVPVRVYRGDRICQVVFHEITGARRPYTGKYTRSTGVHPARPDKEGR